MSGGGGGSGANPFGAQPRPARPVEFGIGYSGNTEVRHVDRDFGVLNNPFKEVVPNGYAGLAAVHIFVSDLELAPPSDIIPNAVLVGELSWQSGRGTGQQLIDLTRGHLISVGGTSYVGLRVRLVSSILGQPTQAFHFKRVEATINWFGHSHNPGKVATPAVTLLANTASDFEPIPLQAREMIAYATDPASLPNMIAEFSTTPAADGSGVKYATLNPNANGSDIEQGVGFVRFTTDRITRVFGSYNLW